MKYSASAVLLVGVMLLGAWSLCWPSSRATLPAGGGRDVGQLTELTRAVQVAREQREALARGLAQVQQIAGGPRVDGDLPADRLIEPRPPLSGSASPAPGQALAEIAVDPEAGVPVTGARPAGASTAAGAAGPGLPSPPVLTTERVAARASNRGEGGMSPMPVQPVPETGTAAATPANLSHLLPALYAYRVSMIYLSPDRRFAVIDGLFRREGDVLTTGARVRRIHAEGVELQYENENTARWIGLMAD